MAKFSRLVGNKLGVCPFDIMELGDMEMKRVRSPPWAQTPPVVRRTSARPGGSSPIRLHQVTVIRKRRWGSIGAFGVGAMPDPSPRCAPKQTRRCGRSSRSFFVDGCSLVAAGLVRSYRG